ncbi:MAG: alanine--tRNA ligase [Lachnospiraceae bacterium]|nr:alanine--tRNA ligase [Lachnospiraceae bacterium]
MKKPYGLNELRKMFLDYFESKGHLVLPSFSLVPHNDNSLLLINAGMAPLKPYFTGAEEPPRHRVATCQKCMRTGDLENVGKDGRHATFFEMLGNFSFGDYFKHEAIAWTWEFLTQYAGLEPERLYPSVYQDDDEAFDIWNKEIGIPADRIYRFGKEDNFWEHGSGPCGPCSEVYYDRGEKYGCGKPTCGVGCDCDRYMEVWNNVFTQFDNDGHNNYTELKQKNIDTGMGLERLAVAVQDVDTIFDVDTIRALREMVCETAGVTYETDFDADVSIRIITDHIRAATFMISDGIQPSNEGRGYVLRRIIRRASRNGRLLGIKGKFLAPLSEKVIETSKEGYPELEEKREFILKVLTQEEDSFNRTLDTGLSILNEMEQKMSAEGSTVLAGADAFKLYDTYGFPLDLTKEILGEKGYSVDDEGFASCMEEQRRKARDARKYIEGASSYMGADATVYDQLDRNLTTEFTGYDSLVFESKISALTTPDEVVQVLSDGQEGSIFTEKSPFYATMGGQMNDVGVIEGPYGTFEVTDVEKLLGGKFAHIGKVTRGMFASGDIVTLKVDEEHRSETAKNHSATHLLQKALRIVLGSHVEQKGSMNNNEKLRFDFSHFQAMTPEEIRRVEDIVNEEIEAALPVITNIMSLEEAKKTGAMALFGEKYGDSVRVVTMGDFSRELCGGTHVKNTALISSFKILSEQGVSSGVRRIEAITGPAVRKYYQEMEDRLNQAAKTAKCDPAQLSARIEALHEEVKALSAENSSLRNQAAKSAMGDVMSQVREVKGVKFLPVKLKNVSMQELMNLGDQLKTKLGEGVVLLAADNDGKVSLLAMATDGAMKSGAHAGNIIKAAAGKVGGGGGGRPNMAQAGGKNPAGIDDALAFAQETLSGQIK